MDVVQKCVNSKIKALFSYIFLCLRGGGDLLRQLHDLAEAESELQGHQRRLADIEAQVNP